MPISMNRVDADVDEAVGVAVAVVEAILLMDEVIAEIHVLHDQTLFILQLPALTW
jgi:hypothetical protein